MAKPPAEILEEYRKALTKYKSMYQADGTIPQKDQDHLNVVFKRLHDPSLAKLLGAALGGPAASQTVAFATGVVLAGSPLAQSQAKAVQGKVVPVEDDPPPRQVVPLGDDSVEYFPRLEYWVGTRKVQDTNPFPGGDNAPLILLSPDTNGELRVFIRVELTEIKDAMGASVPMKSGTDEYRGVWNVRVDQDGAVSIDYVGGDKLTPKKGERLRVQVASTKEIPKKWPERSQVVITLMVMDELSKGGGGWNVSVDLPKGGGAGIGKQDGTIQTTGNPVHKRFTVNINVNSEEMKAILKKREDEEKRRQHEKTRKEINDTIDKIPDKIKTFKKVPYEIGPFVRGKHDKLDTGDLKSAVMGVFRNRIPAEVQDLMRHNKLPQKIEVHGHTSNTDTKERNYILSKKRAEAVIAAFDLDKSIFLPPEGHGEWDAKATDVRSDEKEDAAHRKVVLVINEPQDLIIPKPPKMAPLPKN